MQINLATRHGHLSEKTQNKISEKISKLTRFHDRLTTAEITVDLKDEECPKIEVQIAAKKAGRFLASEDAGQLMTALDSVVHKLEQQLRKHKERVTDRHRQSARRTVAESDESLDESR